MAFKSTAFRRSAAIFVLAFGLAGAAHAQEGDPRAELKTLQDYGAGHKACDGWTNGCALCARRSDGSLGCSRMGVDCEVTEIQCTQRARDPKTGKTPPPQ